MRKEHIINYVDLSFKSAQGCIEITRSHLNEIRENIHDKQSELLLDIVINMVNTDLDNVIYQRNDAREFLQKVLPTDPKVPDLVTEANEIDES